MGASENPGAVPVASNPGGLTIGRHSWTSAHACLDTSADFPGPTCLDTFADIPGNPGGLTIGRHSYTACLETPAHGLMMS